MRKLLMVVTTALSVLWSDAYARQTYHVDSLVWMFNTVVPTDFDLMVTNPWRTIQTGDLKSREGIVIRNNGGAIQVVSLSAGDIQYFPVERGTWTDLPTGHALIISDLDCRQRVLLAWQWMFGALELVAFVPWNRREMHVDCSVPANTTVVFVKDRYEILGSITHLNGDTDAFISASRYFEGDFIESSAFIPSAKATRLPIAPNLAVVVAGGKVILY